MNSSSSVPVGALMKAREASDSIKPGARAPGHEIKILGARETGDSLIHIGLPPASRAPRSDSLTNLGLAPQALCCRPLRGLGACF
jgi:hypothetical protein